MNKSISKQLRYTALTPSIHPCLVQSALVFTFLSCVNLSSLSLTNIHFVKATYFGNDGSKPHTRLL